MKTDVTLQQQIISGLLLTDNCRDLGGLGPYHFSDKECRDAFSAIYKSVQEGKTANLKDVGEVLFKAGKDVSSVAKLSSPVNGTKSTDLSKLIKKLIDKKRGPSPVVISAADLLSRNIPPRKNILDPWLPDQGLTLLHAYRGVGKTHVSLGVACAVATGSTFLGWTAEKAVGVLFIDGEMPAVTIQERIAYTLAGMEDTGSAPFQIITPDLQKDYGVPDLATKEGQSMIDRSLTEDIKLIIVDNISTVCRSTHENKGDSWLPVQEWALRMRASGRSVLLIHHEGKGGQQRGTSRKEDILDTVIQLKHPADYSPDRGAVFEVHFKKNRGIHGKDVKPFEASLMMLDGVATWATRSLEDSIKDKVKRLLDDGYQQKDIAEELKITKGYVSKLVKRIKAED